MLRKIFYALLMLAIVVSMASCARKDKKTGYENTNRQTYTSETVQNQSSNSDGQTSDHTDEISATKKAQESSTDKNNKAQLIQSASVDLDNDGKNEVIEALKIITKGLNDTDTGELEGILRITSVNGTKNITFIKKQAGLTDVMSSFEFADLDGDGAKDVFVIMPDSGAAFSLNYFYIYNYKKDKSFSFTSDSSLAEFANGFRFSYKGKGKLEIINDKFKFNAVFNIKEDPGFESEDENNEGYESSWVEPTPVEISVDSRIALIKASDGAYEIKVPLPVFGLATVDMIGEIDLYYSINSDFLPILDHFTVYDYKIDSKDIIGKCIVK